MEGREHWAVGTLSFVRDCVSVVRTRLGQSAYGCRGSAVHGVETEPRPSLISRLVSGRFTPFSPTRGQGPGGGEGRRSPSTLAFLEGPRPALASSSLKLVYILRGDAPQSYRFRPSFRSLFHRLAPPGPGEGQRPSSTRPFPGRALHHHSASSAGRADVGVLPSFSWIVPNAQPAGISSCHFYISEP